MYYVFYAFEIQSCVVGFMIVGMNLDTFGTHWQNARWFITEVSDSFGL